MSSASRFRAGRSGASRFVADGGAASRFVADGASASRFLAGGGAASRFSPGGVMGGGLMSALANLSQPLTINGVTVQPTFLYEGKNATTSEWVATVGQDLPVSGSGADPSVDEETALLSTTDKAVSFDGKYYAYGGAAAGYASPGTDDFVIEWVGRCGPSAAVNQYLWRSYSSTGLLLYITSSGQLRLTAVGASAGAGIVSDVGAIAAGAWYHGMVIIDASGYAQVYVNGEASGAAVDVSGLGTIINDLAPRLGGNTVGGQFIARLAMWQGAIWLDTHKPDALVAARFKALCGANTDESRDSTAYLHKPVSGALRYFLVGKNWMRLSKGLTGAAAYQKEAAATNDLQQSDNFSAWTVRGTASVTSDDTPFTPIENAHTDLLSVSTKTNDIYRLQSGLTADADAAFSMWVKRVSTSGTLVIEHPSGAAYGEWDIDLSAMPDEFVRLTADSAHVVESAPFKNSGSGSGGALMYSDTGAVISYHAFGAQYEESDAATSYIPTTTSAVTRLADA